MPFLSATSVHFYCLFPHFISQWWTDTSPKPLPLNLFATSTMGQAGQTVLPDMGTHRLHSPPVGGFLFPLVTPVGGSAAETGWVFEGMLRAPGPEHPLAMAVLLPPRARDAVTAALCAIPGMWQRRELESLWLPLSGTKLTLGA